MIKVRKATEADLPRIVEMMRHFNEASMRYLGPFSEFTVAELMRSCIRGPDRTVLLAEKDEKIGGMIVLVLLPYVFNWGFIFCHEVAWWVEPEFRGAGVGRPLLDAAEKWGDEKGASHMEMGSFGTSDPVGAVFSKRGYQLLETHYVKRIEP